MPLILQADSTIKMVNSCHGGQIRQARASKSSKIALWSNFHVGFIITQRNHSYLAFLVAYSIDDGKGGRIHVNVSYCLLLGKAYLIVNNHSGKFVCISASLVLALFL